VLWLWFCFVVQFLTLFLWQKKTTVSVVCMCECVLCKRHRPNSLLQVYNESQSSQQIAVKTRSVGSHDARYVECSQPSSSSRFVSTLRCPNPLTAAASFRSPCRPPTTFRDSSPDINWQCRHAVGERPDKTNAVSKSHVACRRAAESSESTGTCCGWLACPFAVLPR